MKDLDNWTLVFTTSNKLEAHLAEDVLKQHGIESNIIDNIDSAFATFGEAKLYTLDENAVKAVEILKETDFKKEG